MGKTKFESLSALVEARLQELGWSGRQAGLEAAKRGIDISATTINKVRVNQINLTAERIEALAAVLKLPVDEVMEAAGHEYHGDFASELPRDVNLLTRSERDVVLAVIGAFLGRR
ncbi:helix-turn-helix domain-containing protein [Brevibacterium moorei]|uniref:helix-turn-helix domain-containing protein n=1 Tax=Brevibacterium moorei TaxID=2968457 RepID=UPI00211BB6C3|nr:helix-turn-helix transcriptional regulator [Brevibacterium sp. 68QC2CO]MCQ9384382.1 helix-turn-helix domain-containing protein [Brevibacterium sp. 68QC2CO]